MYDDDYTIHERPVRIRLDAKASRPPGRGRAWTVEAGRWSASASTEKAAADALTAGLGQFIRHYQPPKLLTFRGYTAIVELDLGGDNGSLNWHWRTVSPDGRECLGYSGAASWAEAEAEARHSLARQSTDWHDDASVHGAAAYLDHYGCGGDDRYGSDELYRYASWQRAAKAAMDAGREDWHEWASAHAKEFAVPRPAETAG